MNSRLTSIIPAMAIRRQGLMGLLGASVVVVAACGGGNDNGGDDSGGAPTAGGASTASGGASNGSGGIVIDPGGGGSAEGGSPSEACAEATAVTTLRTVRLAFVFDVSGSMGKDDKDWHDPELKWEPVVAATKAFFEDPESAGLEASLSFFPASDNRCDPESYVEPEVDFEELPSSAFADAIDAVTPESADDWRGGTPTLAALSGTIARIEPLVEAEPDTVYAIVLVSDGYPQSCDDNSIESVSDVVASVSDTIPTYVIGVRNPPLDGAPDTVSDLDAIAVAGATNHAYFIDTGEPASTTSDLLSIINGIRGETLSCDLPIPDPPEGRELDPQRVKVTSTSGTESRTLAYDKDCATSEGWHYDDPDAPTSIELCPDACAAAQADPDAALSVAFACEVTIPTLY